MPAQHSTAQYNTPRCCGCPVRRDSTHTRRHDGTRQHNTLTRHTHPHTWMMATPPLSRAMRSLSFSFSYSCSVSAARLRICFTRVSTSACVCIVRACARARTCMCGWVGGAWVASVVLHSGTHRSSTLAGVCVCVCVCVCARCARACTRSRCRRARHAARRGAHLRAPVAHNGAGLLGHDHLCCQTQHALVRLVQRDAQLVLHQLAASEDGNVLQVRRLALAWRVLEGGGRRGTFAQRVRRPLERGGLAGGARGRRRQPPTDQRDRPTDRPTDQQAHGLARWPSSMRTLTRCRAPPPAVAHQSRAP
jgi:hypothetical protein